MSQKPSNRGAPHRLLIVDDDPLIRLLARERLGSEAFDVYEAGSGAEGVDVFADVSPDLVLLDVEMPIMNGFDVCKAIRASAGGKHVPILILTGRDDVRSIEQAYRVGATDFVTKPLNWLILVQRIRYILRASESFLAVRAQEEQVRVLAFTDSLTGLANRAAFMLHLENAIQRNRRRDLAIGILYLDLDQFKRVNDTFGHTAGDGLLQWVADELNSCIRDTDVVARDSHGQPGATISRLGGDEFTILLEGLRDPSDAGLVAERVLETLSRFVVVEEHEIRTTASIGIAICPHDGADVETLLRNADSAMYHAKERGRANFQFYREEFNSRALERLELESDLSRALEHGQLFVHFQPKLELATRRISGCEALARWKDPRRGFVAPSVFVPLAESSGLISGLGEAVLRQACLGARRLQNGGHPDFQLAVNLSPGQIKDDRLVETIESVLSETDFDPRLIEFEITESALIQDEARTVAVLKQLQSRGCRISLDDFGTGYSSLSNLKRFPVQTLKIDRSFVSGIGSSKEDEAIVVAILAMAQNLDMHVVAEGVETDEQLDFLIERKCDEVQGFLVSRPVPLEEVGAVLDRFNRS